MLRFRLLPLSILCAFVLITVFCLTTIIFQDDSLQLYSGDSPQSDRELSVEAYIEQVLEYTRRQKKLRSTCLNMPQGHLQRIVTHSEYKLSYCVVPKAGCTFWINIFRFLHNETGGYNVSRPQDIPRTVTHYGKLGKMKFYNLKTAGNFLPYTFRFLFSRDPYSRLWSAYVDKFFLPDYWWTQGQKIIKRRPDYKLTTSHCANDIDFTEFLSFVVSSNGKNLNEHWCPVSLMCDPCRFQPDIIGNVETFTKDSRFILSQVNLEHLVDDGHKSRVIDEMEILIQYNFKISDSPFYKRCINQTELARRLWITFQINGYLPEEAKFPSEALESLNRTSFMETVKKTYTDNPISKEKSKLQRKKALAEAYKAVPPKIIRKLIQIYATDFMMFDYDPNPSWILSTASDG